MFRSLRERLWITYALVIGVVLILVSLALVFYLANNPAATRQANIQLRLAAALINSGPRQGGLSNADELALTIERLDIAYDVRVILFGRDGSLYLDSRSAYEPAPPTDVSMPKPRDPGEGQNHTPAGADPDQFPILTFRDEDGEVWLYTGKPIANGMYVIVAKPRPTTPLRMIFTDDIFMPIFSAGIAASLLSLLLAGGISNWIASPLQHISDAANEFAEGKLPEFTPEGPTEVEALGHSFIQMARRVFASQQSQRDFVANVSHELKTPLTSIQGFAQAMVDGTADDPETLKDSAQIIYDEAGRMHRLVVELLDLARIDAGTAEFLRDPVDLNPLLHRVIEKFQPQTEEAQVEIFTEIASMPRFLGDGDRLSQVFTNLVDNAIKHTPPGGRVTLAAQQVGVTIEVRIEDNGTGIVQDEIDRIFERFYQVDKARTGGAGRGIGLGLAIANEIVQKHGGHIQVESTPGSGSTFTVILPIAHPDDKPLTMPVV